MRARVTRFGFFGRSELELACGALPVEVRAQYGVDSALGGVAVALAYNDGPREIPAWALPQAGDPEHFASLARFVRTHWYAELSERLKNAVGEIRESFSGVGMDPGPPRAWRRLVNSRLPERRLALAAGIGSLGRSGLVLVNGAGPGCVLGLLLTPFDPSNADSSLASWNPAIFTPKAHHFPTPSSFSEACEGCEACVAACPTGALSLGGNFHRELCLQEWSAKPGPLPPFIEERWGPRLYGCDACLEACPRFSPATDADSELGRLGPGVCVARVLAASDEELKGKLKGSALGLGWISAESLKRNARTASNFSSSAI